MDEWQVDNIGAVPCNTHIWHFLGVVHFKGKLAFCFY